MEPSEAGRAFAGDPVGTGLAPRELHDDSRSLLLCHLGRLGRAPQRQLGRHAGEHAGTPAERPFQKLSGKLLGVAHLKGVVDAETASDLVGRPGLDPGTLGLKERYLLSRWSARIHRPCSGEMSRPPSSAENNPVH